MLDRMFAAIDLARGSPDLAHALYISNIMPWRPPGNRDPHADEAAACRPYLMRQIELIQPRLILSVGRISAAYS